MSLSERFRRLLEGNRGKDDRSAERSAMVRDQIEGREIVSATVLEAFRTIPRHRFVPPGDRHRAYRDHPLAIGCRQTISQPYMVARMTELLDPCPDDRILEVGTGSGYQAAILAALAREVHSIERHPPLLERARETLQALGIENVTCHEGDGSVGLPAHAPYDAILVTAGSPRVPDPLLHQLAEGGRLLVPVGPPERQVLHLLVRTGSGLETTRTCPCVFVPLLGAEGWSDEDGNELDSAPPVQDS